MKKVTLKIDNMHFFVQITGMRLQKYIYICVYMYIYKKSFKILKARKAKKWKIIQVYARKLAIKIFLRITNVLISNIFV